MERMDAATLLSAMFSAATRLYALEGDGALAQLQVERWYGEEALSTCYAWTIDALSTDANLPLDTLLGRRGALRTTLADGTRTLRSGLVREARQVGADGGLARYRLVLAPWLWLLSQGRHSRVFQDRCVLDIVEAVFGAYAPHAAWKVTPDARAQVGAARPRSYTVQYRETDLAFVERLLAEDGLGYAFEEDPSAPAGHVLVVFADSTQLPEDASSAAGTGGLRFHRAAAVEASDALQALGAVQALAPDAVTLLSHDYKTGAATAAQASLREARGRREAYDPVGPYAFADSREAAQGAHRLAQAHEARQRRWEGRGTVRSARAGTRFRLSQAPWQDAGPAGAATGPDAFVWTRLHHAGINNLPEALRHAALARLGTAGTGTDTETPSGLEAAGTEAFAPALWSQAEATGYAQHFGAVARDVPWRPVLADGHGLRRNPRPTAPGLQTAIVVGPQGETVPGASGPLHTDALGRLKVRFHWQRPDDPGGCWLRVAQRYAGGGLGAQFLPRIGQEVLVGFLEGDIDRPVIVGALYNGQGEAGQAPTPGGAAATDDTRAYAQAADHRPSAQGNPAGGHSPAWHGQGGGRANHGHAAALSGLKSQGFDGTGHNQLVFDDSDGQGRVQFASTQAMSQLTLGHLIHQADNYRGSFRGQGFELRTDAWGAVRAGRGLLLSSYAASAGGAAGDAVGATALLRQQGRLAQALDQAAADHHTVPLAGVRGVEQANRSRLVADQAPLAALQRTLATTVDGTRYAQGLAEAPDRDGRGGDGRLPHTGDAVLGLAARGGQAIVAGQALHWAAGETLTLGSGQATNLAVNHRLRLHGGQALGWLAGAQRADGVGLTLAAGQGALEVQAQHGPLALRSQGALTLVSANAEAELAAAKTLHLAVGGGASVTIADGHITFACPGQLTVHAGRKSFVGPAHLSREMNDWGEAKFNDSFQAHYPDGSIAANRPYELVRADGARIQGTTDADGIIRLQKGVSPEGLMLRFLDQGEETS